MKIRFLFILLAVSTASIAQDFSKMTKEERDAYFQKIREASAKDQQLMLELLKIKSLRPGVNGWDKNPPNPVNYDEAKANPFSNLPDALTFKNGKKVTNAKQWQKRRQEIIEDFDREIYGRTPTQTPKVNWEVVSTSNETNGDFSVIVKKLIGHVDNSSYPQIKVDIELTLATPANTT